MAGRLRRLAAAETLNRPDMKPRSDPLALEPIPGTPDAVQPLADQEQARWARIVRERNIRLD